MELFEQVEKWLEEGKDVIVHQIGLHTVKVKAVGKRVQRYLQGEDETGQVRDITYLNEYNYRPKIEGNRVVLEYVPADVRAAE